MYWYLYLCNMATFTAQEVFKFYGSFMASLFPDKIFHTTYTRLFYIFLLQSQIHLKPKTAFMRTCVLSILDVKHAVLLNYLRKIFESKIVHNGRNDLYKRQFLALGARS